MSIQDESFPDDEFLNELDFSKNAGKFFHYRQKRDCKAPPPSTTNTSSSSTDQNLSGESTNGRPSSGLSSKTTESEPANLAESTKKQNELIEKTESKAISYQDIHTEYTKRRYKHVESKVGIYIANLKAEDEKRKKQARFQRYHSMPETLSGAGANTDANRRNAQVRYSAAELHKMDESTSEAEADSSENMTGTTSASSSSRNRHESSDDANVATVDLIDKQTYAALVSEKERIQSYMDYLQMKLDEKNGENMRLKRNVEFMRIELSNCKDKLKKQTSSCVGTHTMGGSYGNIAMGIAGGGMLRHSLQGLLHCPARMVKSTQTDVITSMTPPPPPPPLYVTPNTPDTNNNDTFDGAANCKSSAKNIATIQPLSLNFSNIVEQDSVEGNNSANGVLRQRTNSNPLAKGSSAVKATNAISISKSQRNFPSSSNSVIEIEKVELASPKPSLRNLLSPKRSRREEFIYYDERTGRFAALETRNANGSKDDEIKIVVANNDTSPSSQSTDVGNDRATKKKHKMSFLRRRWLRLFGPCTRCNESKPNLESSALEQTYTQIPLLDKSFENHCRNFH